MADVKSAEQEAQELVLEQLKATNALDLQIKEELLRKAKAEADQAELMLEYVRRHGASILGLPKLGSS